MKIVSKSIVYGVISIFIIAILFQLNSYLTIINIPNNNIPDQQLPQPQHQQAYHVLVFYLSILFSSSAFILFQSWISRRKRLISRISTWHRLIHFEYFPFQLFHFNLNQLFLVTCLAGLNLFLFYYFPITTFNTSKLTQQQQYYHVLSNRAAQLAVTNFAFTVVLSAKLSIVQTYFIDLHQTIRWHAWFARIGFIQALYHACFQIQSNYEKQDHDLFLTLTANVRHVSGFSMILATSLLILGSHSMIRKLSYSLFRYTHFFGFSIMILMGCLHHWSFYVFYATVLIFWVMDQLDKGYVVPVAEIEGLPGDILKLQCQLPFPTTTIIPGQFVLISNQSSFLKYTVRSHPFSICRVDQHDNRSYFTFYIKAVGNMTKELAKVTGDHSVTLKNQLRISKPLGRPYLVGGAEFGDFESVVLVAEGVGITPWISVLQYLTLHQHTIQTKSIDIIWSLHTIDTFYAFEKELLAFNEEFKINLQVFVTGPTDPEETYDTFIQFSRPNYNTLFKEIDDRTHQHHVVGICAHETTLIRVNNLALDRSWHIRKEHFEL